MRPQRCGFLKPRTEPTEAVETQLPRAGRGTVVRTMMAVGLVLSGLGVSAAADRIWYKDLNEARAEAERLNRPILCHFGATWCAPCQKMEQSVLNQPKVLDQLKASVVGLKVDVDEHPELARRFGVDRFPTDIFLEPNGQRLLESTGYRTPQSTRR